MNHVDAGLSIGTPVGLRVRNRNYGVEGYLERLDEETGITIRWLERMADSINGMKMNVSPLAPSTQYGKVDLSELEILTLDEGWVPMERVVKTESTQKQFSVADDLQGLLASEPDSEASEGLEEGVLGDLIHAVASHAHKSMKAYLKVSGARGKTSKKSPKLKFKRVVKQLKAAEKPKDRKPKAEAVEYTPTLALTEAKKKAAGATKAKGRGAAAEKKGRKTKRLGAGRNPFKTKDRLGPGPRGGHNSKTGKWHCTCSKPYACVCRSGSKRKKIRIRKSYKSVYNRDFKAYSKSQKHGSGK